MQKKTWSIIALVFMSISSSSLSYAEPTYSPTNPAYPRITVDRNTPSQYALGMCTTDEQLDCIDSVEAKVGPGPFEDPTPLGQHVWTTEIANGVVIHRLQTENSGAPWEPRETVWELSNGLKFMVGADIYTPGNTSDHLGVMGTYAGSFDEAGLPLDFSVRIGIRTSWIRPQNLQFNAVSAKFNQTEIGDGNLWTFSGSPTKIATYTEEKYDRAWEMGWMEKADGEDRWLGFTVGHAGATAADSWFDPKCADEGYMAQAFNSSAAGTPEWNYDTSSLEFNIFAPHLTSEGALNTGFFRLWVHESFAECQWPGNTLVTSDKLEAVILNEDGSTQDADLSVSKVNGVIYLDAGEIHYSVPKFIIKASNSQSTTAPASATPAVKLATTGANVEWMIVAGFLAVIAGSGFLALRRRKRIW
jgi:LPXTG-motif cell wall-anchored protein